MHSYSNSENRVPALGALALLAVIVSIGANWIAARLTTLPPWLVSAPSVAGAFAILYALFDRYIWRWRIIRRLSIVHTPIVSGVYNGILISSYNDTRRDITITIDQTWTHIGIQLQVNGVNTSNSRSMTARLEEVGSGRARLTYTYRNLVSPGLADADMNDHDGTAEVEVNGTEARGRYYNYRGRQGSLVLHQSNQSRN